MVITTDNKKALRQSYHTLQGRMQELLVVYAYESELQIYTVSQKTSHYAGTHNFCQILTISQNFSPTHSLVNLQ